MRWPWISRALHEAEVLRLRSDRDFLARRHLDLVDERDYWRVRAEKLIDKSLGLGIGAVMVPEVPPASTTTTAPFAGMAMQELPREDESQG